MKPQRTTTLGEAAKLLGKHRKQLHRWSEVPGAPFDSDGKVDMDELRAWLESTGRLERAPGRPTEVARVTEQLATAVAAASGGADPAAATRALERAASLEGLPPADREVLETLFAANPERLLELFAQGVLTDERLARAALIGKARQALADAQRRELDNKARRGELVEIEVVRRLWASQIELVKGSFQAAPGKLASRLAGKPYDEVYQVLDDELRAILSAFASGGPS